MSYTEQMSGRGLTGGSKVLVARISDDEPEAAARLSLPPRPASFKLDGCDRRRMSRSPWKHVICRRQTSRISFRSAGSRIVIWIAGA